MTNFDDLFTSAKVPPSGSISFKMSSRSGSLSQPMSTSQSLPTPSQRKSPVPISQPQPVAQPKPVAQPQAISQPVAQPQAIAQPKPVAQPQALSPQPALEPLIQRIVREVIQQMQPSLHLAEGSPKSESLAELDVPLVNRLQAKLDLLQLRQEKMSQQIQNYEAEIEQLQEEKLLLEQTMMELPEIYRQKFATRMEPVRQRIREIQAENRQLRSDVYELSFRLHQQSSTGEPVGWRVRLPQMPKRRALPSGA